MKALHSLKPPLLHRDLTTQNILIEHGINGKRLYAFIADFGTFSLLLYLVVDTLPGISRFHTNDPLSPIGHPRAKAPEITLKSKYYTKKVCVLFL